MLGLVFLLATAWARPWQDADPLEAPAKALLATARKSTATTPAVLLLTEYRVTIADDGSARATTRRVFYARNDAAGKVGALTFSWRPWREERPLVIARTLHADGTESRVDSAALPDAPLAEGDPVVFSDARGFALTVPDLRAGEALELVNESSFRPALAGQGFLLAAGDGTMASEHVRVRIDAPADAPLAWSVTGLAGKTSDRVRGGRREIVVSAKRSLATPVETPFSLRLSTASWEGLAAAYGKLVDDAAAGADVSALEAELPKERDALVAELFRRVQAIRYVGVQLGAGSLVPAPIATTLERRFADCKGKAVLLVALLRRAGIPADVVLLNAGEGVDADPAFPGTEWFNHAIVVVHGDTPRWLDPTDPHGGPSDLPVEDQGRTVLVTGAAGRVATTPVLLAEQNRLAIRRVVHVPAIGGARLEETREMSGGYARLWRAYLALDGSDEGLRQLASGVVGSQRIDDLETGGVAPGDAPVRLTWHVDRSAWHHGGLWTAKVPVVAGALLGSLPEEAGADLALGGVAVPPFPRVVDLTWTIVPLPGWTPQSLPEAWKVDGPGLAATVEAVAAPDHSVEVRMSLRADARPPAGKEAEYAAFRDAISAWSGEIAFADPVGAAWEKGDSATVARLFAERLAEAPRDALARARYADFLSLHGFVAAGRAEAARAVKDAPDDPEVLTVAALAVLEDVDGAYLGATADRATARRWLLHAREADPHLSLTLNVLAALEDAGVDRPAAATFSPEQRAWALALHEAGERDAVDAAVGAALAGEWAEADRLAALSNERPALPVVAALRHVADPTVPWPAIADPALYEDVLRWLLQVRRYEVARALFAATDPAMRAQIDATLLPPAGRGRFEERPVREDAVEDVWLRMVRHAYGMTPADRIYTPEYLEPGDDLTLVGWLRERVRDTDQRRSLLPGLGGDEAAEMEVVGVEGDAAGGYRVRFARAGEASVPLALVVRQGRLLVRGEGRPSEYAEEALARLDQKDLAAARRWLGWARDAIADGSDAKARLAEHDAIVGDGADPTRLRVAASVLASRTKARAKAAEAVLAKARFDGPAGVAIARARIGGLLLLDRDRDALAVLPALLAAGAGDPEVLEYAARTQQAVGDWKGALAAVQRWQAAAPPDDVAPKVELVRTNGRLGDLDAARAALATIPDGSLSSEDARRIAWVFLGRSADPDVVKRYMDLARRLEDPTGRRYGYDLARVGVLADLVAGDVAGARKSLADALGTRPVWTRSESEWGYYRGRLAEAWGLLDVARAEYRTASVPDPRDQVDPLGTVVLARARLAALESK
ncbi:MAG: DUF3857 domain-containing protein [Myxococcota bacterium]